MQLNEVIATRKKEFETLCSRHNVKYLFAFGSSISDRFDPTKSDIDLLVEVTYEDPIIRGEMLISLWDSLEKFFARRVDLLTDASIKNPFLRKSIDSTKVLIHDGSG
ncbi:MAG: nucleotidyltransferase domain-containing protein [Cyclobacterium sp.]|uniref:nucleotidyltransferase family protein n=1 Tax=Cyclobacterium sp. TaxID=1966343 RepID=UPI003971023E